MKYAPCSQHRTPIRLPQVPTRAAAVEDKRALIRAAAVRAFAKKGYHACRVSDIAEELGEPAPEQLRKVGAIVLRPWRNDPDLVRVLVREVTRSPQLQNEIGEIVLAFRALERIIERGKAEGSFRGDVRARPRLTLLIDKSIEISCAILRQEFRGLATCFSGNCR